MGQVHVHVPPEEQVHSQEQTTKFWEAVIETYELEEDLIGGVFSPSYDDEMAASGEGEEVRLDRLLEDVVGEVEVDEVAAFVADECCNRGDAGAPLPTDEAEVLAQVDEVGDDVVAPAAAVDGAVDVILRGLGPSLAPEGVAPATNAVVAIVFLGFAEAAVDADDDDDVSLNEEGAELLPFAFVPMLLMFRAVIPGGKAAFVELAAVDVDTGADVVGVEVELGVLLAMNEPPPPPPKSA